MCLNVVTRVPTRIIQKLCEKSSKEIQIYLAKIQQINMDALTTSSNQVLLFANFDENPLQFDMATGRTLDFRGVKLHFVNPVDSLTQTNNIESILIKNQISLKKLEYNEIFRIFIYFIFFIISLFTDISA